MAEKKGFILFNDYKEQFFALSDYESGKLIKAIFEYATTGELLKLPPKSSVAFGFIKNALDENAKKYMEISKKRSLAAKKSHLNRGFANANTCTRLHTFAADTDTETDTDTDTETDTDTDTDKKENNTHSLTQKARGEFGNVFLSDEGFDALVNEYGADIAAEAVELLSRRIARSGKYKDENHYAAIKDWVILAVLEQRKKQKKTKDCDKNENDKKLERAKKAGFDFDLEDIFEKP